MLPLGVRVLPNNGPTRQRTGPAFIVYYHMQQWRVRDIGPRSVLVSRPQTSAGRIASFPDWEYGASVLAWQTNHSVTLVRKVKHIPLWFEAHSCPNSRVLAARWAKLVVTDKQTSTQTDKQTAVISPPVHVRWGLKKVLQFNQQYLHILITS